MKTVTVGRVKHPSISAALVTMLFLGGFGTATDLAHAIKQDVATVSSLLVKLVKRGLAHRVTNARGTWVYHYRRPR